MKTNAPTKTRPALETLACINERCTLYGQPGQNNLPVRKTYGQDGIRYLRCRCCGMEFSERKNTALWNTKVAEEKAIAVAEHLAERRSLKATGRLTQVHPGVVTRLNRKVGRHGLLPTPDPQQLLAQEAAENTSIGAQKSLLLDQAINWRGMRVSENPLAAAKTIWWALQQGLFAQMLHGPLTPHQDDPDPLEIMPDGVSEFWKAVRSLLPS